MCLKTLLVAYIQSHFSFIFGTQNRMVKNHFTQGFSSSDRIVEVEKFNSTIKYQTPSIVVQIASILVMASDYRIGIQIDYWNFRSLYSS